MLRNYLTIAFRNLRRHKGFTFINVTGLAVGMASCLLIFLYVRNELSYDRFNEQPDRVYRITSDWGDFSLPATNPPVARYLEDDYPDIKIAKLLRSNGVVQYQDVKFEERRILAANPAFFGVFNLPLLRGDPGAALVAPNTVLLTPATARKYFGEADPIGKTLVVDNERELQVTGIVTPAPPQSHFHFDFLVSTSTLADFMDSDAWGSNSVFTYLRLPEGYDAAQLEAQLPAFIDRHAGDDWNGATLALQPLTAIHLHSHHNSELEPNGSAAGVYVFSIIAVFILLIACVNFMNLSTARATERAREVGVRKVVGAQRRQLVLQFLSESVMLALLALTLAIGLTLGVLPFMRAFAGKAITLDAFDDGLILLAVLGVALLVGILAGSYPALVLSGFRPITVLKGVFRRSKGSAWLRKGLVVFQFAISVMLIVGTIVVFDQLDFLRSASLGIDEDQIIDVGTQDASVAARYVAFKEALLQRPGIEDVAASSESLPSELLNGSGFTIEGLGKGPGDAAVDDGLSARDVAVGHGFFETLGAEMVAGRSFSRDFATDSSAIVMNEAAARLLLDALPGVHSPEDLIGRNVTLGYRQRTGPLVGIVKDFNMSSLHEQVEPIIFFIWPDWYDNLLIRVRPDDVPGALANIRDTWERLFPQWPFTYAFADQAFAAQYRAEQQLGDLFTVFSMLAIFIACLGLFGLATYAAQQRTKEIGVRKVLGATVPGLLMLMSKDFVRLVLVAMVVAMPLAYVGMRQWLQTFAYRIDVAWWMFVVAGAMALGIALLTVSYQAAKASLADPVKSLRYE